MAVTNTNEGRLFVSVNASTSNTTEYIRQLFPELPAAQVDQASNQYTNLTSLYPTSLDQSAQVMSDSMCDRLVVHHRVLILDVLAVFICPSYYLLQAMGNKAYKVRTSDAISFYCILSLAQGEFAIPPANHGDDTYYYFSSYVFEVPSRFFDDLWALSHLV